MIFCLFLSDRIWNSIGQKINFCNIPGCLLACAVTYNMVKMFNVQCSRCFYNFVSKSSIFYHLRTQLWYLYILVRKSYFHTFKWFEPWTSNDLYEKLHIGCYSSNEKLLTKNILKLVGMTRPSPSIKQSKLWIY